MATPKAGLAATQVPDSGDESVIADRETVTSLSTSETAGTLRTGTVAPAIAVAVERAEKIHERSLVTAAAVAEAPEDLERIAVESESRQPVKPGEVPAQAKGVVPPQVEAAVQPQAVTRPPAAAVERAATPAVGTIPLESPPLESPKGQALQASQNAPRTATAEIPRGQRATEPLDLSGAVTEFPDRAPAVGYQASQPIARHTQTQRTGTRVEPAR